MIEQIVMVMINILVVEGRPKWVDQKGRVTTSGGMYFNISQISIYFNGGPVYTTSTIILIWICVLDVKVLLLLMIGFFSHSLLAYFVYFNYS